MFVCFFPSLLNYAFSAACLHAQVYIQSFYLKEYMTAGNLAETQTQTPPDMPQELQCLSMA